MSWVVRIDPRPERLIQFEAKLNYFLREHDALAICQYDRRRFPPEVVLDVLRTHPLVVYGGYVCENPYYVPPEEFLSPRHYEREIERMLTRLRDDAASRQRLRQSEEELRQLSRRLLQLQDEERRRIARDLHDSTGQNLVALATMLGQLRNAIPSTQRKSRRLLSKCIALADRCIRELRTLSYVLHPPVLEQAGLTEAIREYVRGFVERSGIQVELELPPRDGRMARDVELALFRVVQESLTNVQLHSGSRRARIRLHRNAELTLEITDERNGDAANPRRSEGPFRFGVGIPSMQERVKLVGGRLEIVYTSSGTTVRVTVPLGHEREKTTHFTG